MRFVGVALVASLLAACAPDSSGDGAAGGGGGKGDDPNALAAGRYTVTQDGECGLGAGVNASGDYVLARTIAAGRYEMAVEGHLGVLTITSVAAAEIVFDFYGARTTGSMNEGELTGRLVPYEPGSWVYAGELTGCDFLVTQTGTANLLNVLQLGDCGFGAGVVATGNYALAL